MGDIASGSWKLGEGRIIGTYSTGGYAAYVGINPSNYDMTINFQYSSPSGLSFKADASLNDPSINSVAFARG